MRKFRWFSLMSVLALLLGTFAPLAASPAAPAVTQVNVAGSFESEIGGSDWSNNDPLTNLVDVNGDGVWKFSTTVPAGSYEYKVVEDGDWGKAYPANNVPLTLPRPAMCAGTTIRATTTWPTASTGDRRSTRLLPERDSAVPATGSRSCLHSWLKTLTARASTASRRPRSRPAATKPKSP